MTRTGVREPCGREEGASLGLVRVTWLNRRHRAVLAVIVGVSLLAALWDFNQIGRAHV